MIFVMKKLMNVLNKLLIIKMDVAFYKNAQKKLKVMNLKKY